MTKLILNSILALLFMFDATSQQQTTPIDPPIKAIREFQSKQYKRDSTKGHFLGSKKENNIFNTYLFYDSINKVLNLIDTSKLGFNDQLNLELLKYSIQDKIFTYTYKAYLNPILADEGFHTALARMGNETPATLKDYENYILRLKDIPRYVDENLELMRKGLKLGISQPRSILTGYESTYNNHIVDDPKKSLFYKPYLLKPSSISETDWKLLTDKAKAAINEQVIESYKKIKVFFDKEYLPSTRTTIGVSNFPDGANYYNELVRYHTTTTMSAEEVYQTGLQEVSRIKAEMQNVIKRVNFEGNLQQFISFLRTDPRFYATTAEQLLKEASFIAKKADGKLPEFFGKLPRQPYGVEPVPDHIAPTYTAGRYSPAPLNSKRPGNYLVNTYELKSRPLYALESLTLHEAVPGHHLQGALAKELDTLPEFRRSLYINAFGEGWGLYSEYLGSEMGFYKDPYSYFGRLTYDMWRACRLVLDVAMHTKGWTREQGVQYLSENTALSLHEVNTEINRYISWPGQALSYKIGELKIKELRKKAEEKLKTKFDIREFHDLILSQGAVTLNILSSMVDRYISVKLK